MEIIARSSRDIQSTSLPEPIRWRRNIGDLAAQTLPALRRKDFGDDESKYIEAIAALASPAKLPSADMPSLPNHFVRPPQVDFVLSELMNPALFADRRGVVLTGRSGAGKSLMASAVARNNTLRRYFCDGILWLGDKPGAFSEQWLLCQLKTLATQFQDLVLRRYYETASVSQPDSDYLKDLSQAKEFFSMWQRRFGLRCLLVVDNVRHSVRFAYSFFTHGLTLLAVMQHNASDAACRMVVPKLIYGVGDFFLPRSFTFFPQGKHWRHKAMSKVHSKKAESKTKNRSYTVRLLSHHTLM